MFWIFFPLLLSAFIPELQTKYFIGRYLFGSPFHLVFERQANSCHQSHVLTWFMNVDHSLLCVR